MARVSRIKNKNYEAIQFITADGVTYELHDPPERYIMTMEGWGEPPLELETSRGSYQHGEFVTAYRLIPRRIIMLLRLSANSRDQYWEYRNNLSEILRLGRTDPNNPTLSSLRWILSNGNIRQLDGMISRGAVYNKNAAVWDEWGATEEIHFTAYIPIIYDPTQLTATLSGYNASATQTTTITYTGTWEEFPVIVVTGPGDGFYIKNTDTGFEIDYNFAIAAGETVTFDLRTNYKTVTSSVHGNVVGKVAQGNGLGRLSIQQNPLVTNGANDFTTTIDSGTVATQVAINYYNRYEAI